MEMFVYERLPCCHCKQRQCNAACARYYTRAAGLQMEICPASPLLARPRRRSRTLNRRNIKKKKPRTPGFYYGVLLWICSEETDVTESGR